MDDEFDPSAVMSILTALMNLNAEVRRIGWSVDEHEMGITVNIPLHTGEAEFIQNMRRLVA